MKGPAKGQQGTGPVFLLFLPTRRGQTMVNSLPTTSPVCWDLESTMRSTFENRKTKRVKKGGRSEREGGGEGRGKREGRKEEGKEGGGKGRRREELERPG